MTTIRASCPNCGDIQLRAPDLTVRVCTDTDQGSYTFRCPECGIPVAKDATRRIVDLLVSSGVRMEAWRLPAELEERPSGPTITPDDVIDFHLLLQGDSWYEELAESVRRAG